MVFWYNTILWSATSVLIVLVGVW